MLWLSSTLRTANDEVASRETGFEKYADISKLTLIPIRYKVYKGMTRTGMLANKKTQGVFNRENTIWC
jgi:hypothetical protein